MPSDPFGGGPPADFSGVPQDGQAASSGSDVSESWTTALIASSNIVLAWLLLVVLLCEVSLARGKRPRLAHNVQIAVWASVPLGLMAVLQIVYYAAGGQAGEPGLAGLLPEWGRYADLSRGQRSLLLSGATRATLFGLWTRDPGLSGRAPDVKRPLVDGADGRTAVGGVDRGDPGGGRNHQSAGR